MPIPILMPALSPTMEEGTLAKWLVKEGDPVVAGDVIAEIETEKATMEVEAVEEGTVGKLLVAEGTQNVGVNAAIALLLEEGEDSTALASFEAAALGAPETSAVAGAGTAAAPPGTAAGLATEVPARTEPVSDTPARRANGRDGRVFASPLARRLAAQGNLDLRRLDGTGPHGRIVKRDVEKAIADGSAKPETRPASAGEIMAPASRPAAASAISDERIHALYEPGSYEVVPHDNMRKIIAGRLTEAKRTIPHFYLGLDCELDALLAARRRLNDMSPADGPSAFKISVNDLIIKALAMALRKVPAANATWTDQGTLRHRNSDIGVAVAIEGGLFTPVIRRAEAKSLSEISNEMKDLAARARNRRLAPHEYQGGTTSISNLGMFGIKKFDAVINPPHASILAVGAGEKRPVVEGDEIRIKTLMSVTLSCDHRVIDGALGAELLGAFKQFIEEPVTMLV